MLPKLICLCGLQGSGKSTYAKKLKDEFEKNNPGKKCVIVSSDQIRAEYPELASDNTKVFNKVYADINYWLRKNDNVIFDATNTTIKARRSIFQRVIEPCKKICYILNTPYEECKERLLIRNQNCGRIYNIETGENIPNPFYVPMEVLEKYHKAFEIPFYEEGWDDITLLRYIETPSAISYLNTQLSLAKGFDQQNKHHTQDLGLHLQSTYDKAKELTNDPYVIEAARYHDVGKLYTKTFGEDGQAHYYSHANVGAYNLLCNSKYSYDKDETLKWVFYINYHMHMYNINSDKSEKKWRAIFGDEKFNNLVIFNKADKYNHANIEESK